MSETPTNGGPATHVAGKADLCPACGQPVRSDDDRRRKRFFSGVALAWLPSLPIVFGLVNAFRGISAQKATGLGAVAGGVAELGVVYFLVLTPVFLLSSIVLLLRSFSGAHPGRAFVATVSLCWSTLLTGIFALGLWWFFISMRRP